MFMNHVEHLSLSTVVNLAWASGENTIDKAT